MNVLVVSPHLDDETLGAGGSLLKHTQQGDKLYWLNFSDIKIEYNEKLYEKRQGWIETVKKMYPIEKLYNLYLTPAGLDGYKDLEIIPQVESFIKEVQPEVMYIPYYGDVHSDHKRVYNWILPFTKRFRYPFIKRILMMEILSETDLATTGVGFLPEYYIDISDTLDKKMKILEVYDSEFKAAPFPRSFQNVKSLATFRGATAGVRYAEAFKVLRIID